MQVVLTLVLCLWAGLAHAALAKLDNVSATMVEVSGSGVVVSASAAGQVGWFNHISATSISASALALSGGSLDGVSIGVNSPAPVVSATNISATSLTVDGVDITGSGADALVNFAGSSGCTVTAGKNVSGCTRISNGRYGVSLSIVMPNANYAVICNGQGTGSEVGWAAKYGSSGTNTTTGFYTDFIRISGGTLVNADAQRMYCGVFGI